MKKLWILLMPVIFVVISGCAGSWGNVQEALRKGEQGNAILHLKEITESDTTYPFAIGILCSSYYENKQYHEAIDACKKALTFKINQNVGWNYLSRAQYKLGQIDLAISSQKNLIALIPDNSDVFATLSQLYGENKQYDEAITAAKRAIELKSDNAVAHGSLGVAYGMKKQYDEAIKALKKAIEIDPKMSVVYGWLGRFLMDQNAYTEAVGAYKKGIAAEPSEPTLHTNLAIAYYRMGRYDDAIATVNRAIELQKEAASSIGIRSLIYRHKGDIDKAFNDAKVALTLNPSDGYARLSLGAAHLDRGQYDESIKLLSLIKDSPTARLLEATTYAKQGKMKEAVNVYLSIPEEELSPKNIPLMNDRIVLLQTFKPIVKEHRDKARSFESKGHYKEALSELSEALKTADDRETQAIQETTFSMLRRNPLLAEFSEMPEDAKKYALRSEFLVKEGNFEQAATELKRAIQIAPYAARLYYNSALINAELKKYPEAIRHMKIYIKATPDAPNARDAKNEIIKWEFMMEKEGRQISE